MPIWEDAVRDGLVRIENGVTAVNRPAGAVLPFGMRARMERGCGLCALQHAGSIV
jgi:hypothetical protein